MKMIRRKGLDDWLNQLILFMRVCLKMMNLTVRDDMLIGILMNIKDNSKIPYLMELDIILIWNKNNKVIGENLKMDLNMDMEKSCLKMEQFTKGNL